MLNSRLSLLLVDDDPFALELQAAVVAAALPDSRVTLFDDPAVALACCEHSRFDCILLDYDMPGLDGLTMAGRLRAENPYTPIILCTGAGDELLVSKALRGGATDYIPKSAIAPQALRRTVLHAIQVCSDARLIDEQRAELETFAFALAHDFKQPLRQITTFANLALEDIEVGAKADAHKHLKYLSGSARRLCALVDVMSQFTLLSRPIDPELVRVGAAVQGVLEALETYIVERQGIVDVTGDAFIMGNETFLHQILQNLVVNGFKYNGSKQPTVVVQTLIEGDNCLIKVRDNGIGISPEYTEQVFKPLARLHTSTEYTGTGLGLTMARKAAAVQGGTISCKSELGVGSEFTVRLPLALQAA